MLRIVIVGDEGAIYTFLTEFIAFFVGVAFGQGAIQAVQNVSVGGATRATRWFGRSVIALCIGALFIAYIGEFEYLGSQRLAYVGIAGALLGSILAVRAQKD